MHHPKPHYTLLQYHFFCRFYLIIPQVTYTENQHHTKPVSQISPINPAHGDLEPNPKFKTVPLKKSSEQKCQPIEQPHRNTPLAQMKLPNCFRAFFNNLI